MYSCRSAGTFNFILPWMINVTLSISIHRTFNSWVTIFDLRPPMVLLSYNVYGIDGLLPHMDVLFWGQHDFPISFLNKDTSRNACKLHGRSSLFDTGTLSNNMKSPYTNVKWHSEAWTYTMAPSTNKTFSQTMTLLTNWTFTELRKV